MKKIAFLSLSALLMLAASCSDDNNEPTRPAVPTDPVTSVPSVADQVTFNAPEQNIDFEFDGNYYTFEYSNGQKITYTLANNSTLGYYAVVKKMLGENVIVPAEVKAIRASDGEELTYKTVAFNLNQEGSETVKTLTVSKDITGGYANNALGDLTATWVRAQLEMMPNLEKVELEKGFVNFTTIDGAIYTNDLKTLVAVPRGRSGIFTIAEDTKTVDDRAFYYCNRLTAITFPAGIESIGDEAVTFNEMLVLLNMEPSVAPATSEYSFGKMAQTSLLRIPAGSKNSYFPAKPEIERPVAPSEPSLDASDEEYMEYLDALAEYNKALDAYNEEMSVYERPVGFRNFTNVEEVNF